MSHQANDEFDAEFLEVSRAVIDSEKLEIQTLTTAINVMRSWPEASDDYLVVHVTASLLRCAIIERQGLGSKCVSEDELMIDIVSLYGFTLIRLCNGMLDSKQRGGCFDV